MTNPDGMARKKTRREHVKRFTVDGLPRDVNDWTEDDWRDLHEAIETIKKRVAARHAKKGLHHDTARSGDSDS